MGNTNGGKFPRVLYNLNLIRSKSGEKHKKAMEWCLLILKKEAKNGVTKWTQKTKLRAFARLKENCVSLMQLQHYVAKK